MKPDELRNAYENFFIKSAAGQHFTDEIIRLLVNDHEEAEKQPDFARDLSQRAAGVRQVKNHIDAVLAQEKKPISKK